MPAPASTQAATLQKFIDGWKKWDAASIVSLFSEDLTQNSLPTNLGINTKPRSKTDLYLGSIFASVNFEGLTVRRIVHDTERGEAAVYAIAKGKLPWDGDSPYHMEFASFLSFTEDGEKIAHIDEMFDSVYAKEFGQKFQAWLRTQGGVYVVAKRVGCGPGPEGQPAGFDYLASH